MRKFRALLWLLVSLSTATALTASAAGLDMNQHLRSDHPDVYTVVKGDTLWDISGRFLDKPWLWPEVWQINPQIENPHLIFPGDRIYLRYVDGQPRLMVERGDASRTYRMAPGTDKLQPEIRSTPLDTAIPAIPLDAIQGFLVQNRVVEPDLLLDAPYVVQGETERIVLGAGDRIYVRGEVGPEDNYNIVRKGPLYVDPDSREVLGQEATYIGLGTITARDEDIATLAVSSTREEIHIADRILPTEQRRVESTFYPSAPDTDVDGSIIAVFGGVSQVGQYDVVVINRGEREGLQAGNVLAIYQRGALARDRVANEVIRLPSERAGFLMLFRVFEKLSYALVLETERPLAVMDEVRNP